MCVYIHMYIYIYMCTYVDISIYITYIYIYIHLSELRLPGSPPCAKRSLSPWKRTPEGQMQRSRAPARAW